MLLSITLTALACATGDDVRSALARLSSDSGLERADGERWLAAHLRPDDLTLVAETLAGGDLEVRTRLAHALGSDEQHFELAVLLWLDREPAVGRTGRDAIGAMAARWFGETELPPRTSDAAQAALRGRFLGSFSLRTGGRALDELIDRIARVAPPAISARGADPGLSLCVDPLLYADPPASAEGDPTRDPELTLTGSLDRILFDSVRGRGARIEGFGLDGPHPWLCVAHVPDTGVESGVELIARWCKQMLDYADRPRGEGAARALAGCGWPAPLAWLEKRWSAHGDRNALSGLLLAAARGRVAGALANEAFVTQALAMADRALAGGQEHSPAFAREVAHALAQLPPVGRDGADLSRAVLAGWSSASEPARALRANVVAGMARADESWRLALKTELARTDTVLEPATALAYLRALAATAGAAPSGAAWEPAVDEHVLARVVRDRAQPQFLSWMQRCAARPPGAWSDPAALAALGRREGAMVLEWWIVTDAALDVAARALAARSAAGESELDLGGTLRARVAMGDAARVARVCERAMELADADQHARIERVALLAGVLDRARCEALLGEVLSSSPPSAADLPLIGAALGYELRPESSEAARTLLAAAAKREVAASKELDAPWIQALALALAGLQARGDTPQAQWLNRELRSALRGKGHPLSRSLADGAWPPHPGAQPTSLDALDAIWAE